MPEKNEKKQEPEKEGDLRRASPEKAATSNVTPRGRAEYWHEQDPKYAN